MKGRKLLVAALLVCATVGASAQAQPVQQDTLCKFDKFNQKAEKFFKYAPAPIIACDAQIEYRMNVWNIFWTYYLGGYWSRGRQV